MVSSISLSWYHCWCYCMLPCTSAVTVCGTDILQLLFLDNCSIFPKLGAASIPPASILPACVIVYVAMYTEYIHNWWYPRCRVPRAGKALYNSAVTEPLMNRSTCVPVSSHTGAPAVSPKVSCVHKVVTNLIVASSGE